MQPDPTLSVSVDQRIAQLRIQFERVLLGGAPPRIEEFLPEVDESARPQLLAKMRTHAQPPNKLIASTT